MPCQGGNVFIRISSGRHFERRTGDGNPTAFEQDLNSKRAGKPAPFPEVGFSLMHPPAQATIDSYTAHAVITSGPGYRFQLWRPGGKVRSLGSSKWAGSIHVGSRTAVWAKARKAHLIRLRAGGRRSPWIGRYGSVVPICRGAVIAQSVKRNGKTVRLRIKTIKF